MEGECRSINISAFLLGLLGARNMGSQLVNDKNTKAKQIGIGEGGFTLIELIIVFSIIGILASMAVTAFYVYREDVEYAKVEADLRNARLAASAFEFEDDSLPAGFSVPLTFSATDGSPLAGNLATILPGGSVSPDVMLGASYDACDATSHPFDLNSRILSLPCRADRYAFYVKFCGGFNIYIPNIALPGGIC